MTHEDASQFSRMSKAPERIPIWYWNRQVLLQLRAAVREQLQRAGAGSATRVLELGCGNRPYERLVREIGARYEGADLTGNPHADLLIGEDGRVPVPDGSYDIVLSIQVLEHVPNTAAYLAEAARLLRPGGHLILSTHGIWVFHASPNDFWRWTAVGLRKILADNGYVVKDFRGVIGLAAGSLQLFQDSLRKRLPKLLRKPFTTALQALVALVGRLLDTRHHRDRDAMIYMVLAEPALPPGKVATTSAPAVDNVYAPGSEA